VSAITARTRCWNYGAFPINASPLSFHPSCTPVLTPQILLSLADERVSLAPMLGSPPRLFSSCSSSPSNPDSWGQTNDLTLPIDLSLSANTSYLRRRFSGRADHPLESAEDGSQSPPDSRPSLRRLTSETERQVAESSRSGSEKGSLDLLRMSMVQDGDVGNGEVEVLIHYVGCNQVYELMNR